MNIMNNDKLKSTPADAEQICIVTPDNKRPYSTRDILIDTLRWIFYIPIGIFITNLAVSIVLFVADFIDSFLPEELSGLIATRATLVVIIPLIACITFAIPHIAPKPILGAILYVLIFGILRFLHVIYLDESIGYALLYFIPVIIGGIMFLRDNYIPSGAS